ncbi:hypothetical protein [Salininema proteolyticum]|uniref:Holliday junction resolvase n=1 Tax=Salininema proteolyticum TaxID=1607685 RepID=A0ABV8TTL9_9ACTN
MSDQPLKLVKARNRRNRRAGADWQNKLLHELRAEGFDTERLALAGSEDEGDLIIRRPYGEWVVIEAKAGQMFPGDFVDQTMREKNNFARHRAIDPSVVSGVAIVKRRGRKWHQAYVLTTVEDYFGLQPRAGQAAADAREEPDEQDQAAA